MKILICTAFGLMSITAPLVAAETNAKSTAKKTEETTDASSQGGAIKRPEKTVRYKKSKKVDFGDQTIEGNIQRPKAALITGSEASQDSGILRLREDFLDRFASDNGEEIK